MSRKSAVLLILLFIAPVLIYFLWPSDENRIKKLFREGAGEIENEQLDGVMAKVSFNYRDEYGLSYLHLKEVLERVFRQMDDITIEYEITGLDIRDRVASAVLDIRVIATYGGTDTGYILGDAARPAQITFALEKERAKWLVAGMKGIPEDRTM